MLPTNLASEARNALVKARRRLLWGTSPAHGFYSSILVMLKEAVSTNSSTACTDGYTLWFNPTYFLKMEKYQPSIIVHEALHCAFLHHLIRKDMDLRLFNLAADLVVNEAMKLDGLPLAETWFQLGKVNNIDGREYDLRKWPTNLSTVEYYRRLKRMEEEADGKAQQQSGHGDDEQSIEPPEEDFEDESAEEPGQGGQDAPAPGPGPGKEEEEGEQEGPGDGQGGSGPGKGQEGPGEAPADCDPGGAGGVVDAPEQSAAEVLEWRAAVAQAVENAKAMGDMPGSASMVMENVLKPQIPWEDRMASYFYSRARTEYDFRKPSKRWLPHGVIAPSMRNNQMGTVVIAIDTSGSCCTFQSRFAGAVLEMLAACPPEKVVIIWCDCRINEYMEFDDVGDITEKHFVSRGGGGTSHVPVFEKVDAEGLEPDVLVALTDLATRFPDRAAAYDVLWVTPYEGKAPFGDVLVMK